MDTLKRFGQMIRDRRLERDLSQEDLAELADVHRTYIGAVERGEKNITLKNMEKLARALKSTIKELLP